MEANQETAKINPYFPISISASEESDDDINEGSSNAAIEHCISAHNRAFDKAKAEGKSSYDVVRAASRAFKMAIPPLDSPQNITDFIACVARGAITRVIEPEDVTRLLYAAQVANCVKNPASAAPKRPNGRPKKEQKKTAGSPQFVNASANTPSPS